MKKIMFNDKYGLTDAVLSGRKIMTRRVVPAKVAQMIEACASPTLLVPLDCIPSGMSMEEFEKQWKNYDAPVFIQTKSKEKIKFYDARQEAIKFATYNIGEEIAVAQAYKYIRARIDVSERDVHPCAPGWNNKMFVRADLMPHRIRITNIRVERLQDISDEDCIREGVEVEDFRGDYRWGFYTGFFTTNRGQGCKSVWCNSPQKAFAAHIDKVSGRGTWERNPWVFAYSFELCR